MARPQKRAEVLRRITDQIGFSHDDSRCKAFFADRDLVRFCPVCGEEMTGSRIMDFECSWCRYKGPRALTFRKEARFVIDNEDLLHFSVGGAVFCHFQEEKEPRILLLRRATHPVGAFSIPSGHWDITDQDPLEAAKREVKEESGIASPKWELVSEVNELVEDACRRGADLHYWHFYRGDVLPNASDLSLTNDSKYGVVGESDMLGWLPIAQVKAGMFWLTQPAGRFLGKILGTHLTSILPL